MKKGVTTGEPAFRVTRARVAASQSSSSELLKEQGVGRLMRKNSKRSVQDENKNNGVATGGVQNKRRAVLKDVTNMCCDNSYKNCIVPAKIPKKNSVLTKKNPVTLQRVSAKSVPMRCDESKRSHIRSTLPKVPEASGSEDKTTVSQLQSFSKKGKSKVNEKLTVSSDPDFIDIDSDKKDPQLCSLYVCEIYSNLRVAELIHRPRFNFMETVQRDVTQSMRGVLVDWLVEVSVEYKLEPDTLHRTVYLIDMFLSKNYIERQKLQLLGITCMLIASKYEETIAPSVEEFCIITDSTYTKSEVLKMESQVLNILNFHLSPPTAQTFLRRFIRAAQASHQSMSLELECLASYLAELTLIDYNFLVFVPSNIAAAAVFLARWMLDQSGHPWNHTLEHYTNYKPLDLKNTVFALHGLHLSDSNSPLTVIRTKYRQDKFNRVASLPSRELSETLF
ncbi:putative cyclin domain-containing protein [Helianthus debilis subsp. tardiflorus]